MRNNIKFWYDNIKKETDGEEDADAFNQNNKGA